MIEQLTEIVDTLQSIRVFIISIFFVCCAGLGVLIGSGGR